MSYFSFDGQKSCDFGLTIEEYPAYVTAEKRVTEFDQPNANGVWVYDTGRFGNAAAEYAVYLKAFRGRLPEAAARVATWLQSPPGYRRLEDTYDPDHYRLARFVGPLDLSSWFHWYGRATLQFSCLPQRWLISGQNQIVLNGTLDSAEATPRAATIVNPGMPSAPLVTMYGNGGAGALRIGGQTIFLTIPSSGITIDCYEMTAYAPDDPETVLTGLLSGMTTPLEIPAGMSEIRWSDTSETINVVPRWWHL